MTTPADLGGDRARRFARLVAARGLGERAPIPRGDAPTHPQSVAQEALWFLDRLQPGTAVFNIPVAFRLAGPLDTEALRAAVAAVAVRQEMLRTRFGSGPEGAFQRIAPVGTEPLPFELRRLPEGDRSGREAAARRAVGELARQGFDLEREPPWRLLVLELEPDAHVLGLVFHHIAADGWSIKVFFRELAIAYRVARAGRPAALPALPVRYADIAAWFRSVRRAQVLERQLPYWLEHMRDAPPLDLAFDCVRRPRQSDAGRRRTRMLGPGLVRRLTALATTERASLFMACLACFEILLHRYTGQHDVVVGTPVANRPRPELEDPIGLFINTLPVRVGFDDDPPFRRVLARVRAAALALQECQEVPFEDLVERLAPARSGNRNPLFQALIVFQNTPGELLTLEGVDVERLEVTSDTAQYDLNLYLSRRGDDLKMTCEFNADLFRARTIDVLLAQLARIAAQAAAQPELRAGDFALAASGAAAPARPAGVGRLDSAALGAKLERALDARRRAIVLEESGGARLTGAALLERARAHAAALARHGIGAGARVGCASATPGGLLLAALATLRARAVVVPLDARAALGPERRLDALLAPDPPEAAWRAHAGVFIRLGSVSGADAGPAGALPRERGPDPGPERSEPTAPRPQDPAWICVDPETGADQVLCHEELAARVERLLDVLDGAGPRLALRAFEPSHPLTPALLLAPLAGGGVTRCSTPARRLPRIRPRSRAPICCGSTGDAWRRKGPCSQPRPATPPSSATASRCARASRAGCAGRRPALGCSSSWAVRARDPGRCQSRALCSGGADSRRRPSCRAGASGYSTRAAGRRRATPSGRSGCAAQRAPGSRRRCSAAASAGGASSCAARPRAGSRVAACASSSRRSRPCWAPGAAWRRRP